MKAITNPKKDTWQSLCKRPGLDVSELEAVVTSIFNEVQEKGDQALFDFAKRFDQAEIEKVEIDLSSLEFNIDPELEEAIKLAKDNIETFHNSQKEEPKR